MTTSSSREMVINISLGSIGAALKFVGLALTDWIFVQF